MLMLKVLGMTWAGIVFGIIAVRGQTIHYDEALVKMYARLSQQLRKQIFKAGNDVKTVLEMSLMDVASKQLQIDTQKNAAAVSIADSVMNVTDLGLKSHVIFTPALKAEMTQTYTDASLPLYGEVQLDHGIAYSGSTGEAVITKPGVYLLEFKVQTADFSGFNSKIEVVNGEGDTKYTFTTYHDWEVSPFFEMLKLETGDKLMMYALHATGTWYTASRVVAGAATQFNLRYLGIDVPLAYTTSAPDVATTFPGPIWWG